MAEPAVAQTDFARDELPELHAVMAELREHAAVAPIRFHGQTAFLVTRFAELQAAFADDETFPSADAYSRIAMPSMGRTIQCMGGAEHRRNRALVSKAFRPRLMSEFVESFLTPVAHDLIDGFAERGEVDLVEAYTTRYAFTVIGRLLDLPPTDFAQLKRWGDGLLEFPWDPEGALAAREEFTAYLQPLVDARRSRPGEDLLSSLACVEVDGEHLSDEEILSFVRLLFPAGADTTYRALGSLLYNVLSRREIFESVRQPGRVADVVTESLRFEPPVPLLPRYAPRDVRFGGVDIPGGSDVVFGIASANRDARVFGDPDRFDPDRPERDLLSFGHGPHFCLGSHLARREMEVSLRALAERLPDLELAEGDVGIVGTVLRGPERLPVRFAPRRRLG